MGFGKFIRKGVGLLGKAGMQYADSLTGGLASKVVNKTTDIVNQHAGLIGKVASTVGKHFLTDDQRK